MKKFLVLLPAILLAALLVFGGWRLCGKFDAARDEIRKSRPEADSTAVIPPADSPDENDE